MYRGSSGLLQTNRLAHEGAIKILLSARHTSLKCHSDFEVTDRNISGILALRDDLSAHYSTISFSKGDVLSKAISATQTLTSKIMLGTFGCVPAYDQYFRKGLKVMGIRATNFEQQSLRILFAFVDKNKTELTNVQKKISEKYKAIIR